MDIKDKIRKATDDFFEQFPKPTEDVNETVENVDIYQRNVNERIDNSKKSFPKGSSAIVATAVADVVDEALAHAHRKARDDSDLLRKKGDKRRAEWRRQQYMEEYFLPAVEIVVNSTTPDEVLNNKKALEELDKYALLAGSGKGYTASYIRSAYGNQLGQKESPSDPYIRSEIRKLNALLDEGEIRSALGLAKRMKDKVDNGESLASGEDYELISEVVTYYD